MTCDSLADFFHHHRSCVDRHFVFFEFCQKLFFGYLLPSLEIRGMRTFHFFCFFMIFRAGGIIVGAGAEISGAGIEILGAGREILGVQGLNLGPEGEIWGLLDKLFFEKLFFFAF